MYSITSHLAKKAIAPHRVTLQNRVLLFIHSKGVHGSTDEEIERELVMKGSTVRPRRGELVDKGIVVDSGYTRMTTSNKEATVWVTIDHKLGTPVPTPVV